MGDVRMRCRAEAPYDDDVAYCHLPPWHLSEWHEGLVVKPCGTCKRRDCHADECPETWGTATYADLETVRWLGPAEPIPYLPPGVKRHGKVWKLGPMARLMWWMGESPTREAEALRRRREHMAAIVRG